MSASAYHAFYKTVICKGEESCKGVVIDAGAFIGTHSLILAKLGFETHGERS